MRELFVNLSYAMYGGHLPKRKPKENMETVTFTFTLPEEEEVEFHVDYVELGLVKVLAIWKGIETETTTVDEWADEDEFVDSRKYVDMKEETYHDLINLLKQLGN